VGMNAILQLAECVVFVVACVIFVRFSVVTIIMFGVGSDEDLRG